MHNARKIECSIRWCKWWWQSSWHATIQFQTLHRIIKIIHLFRIIIPMTYSMELQYWYRWWKHRIKILKIFSIFSVNCESKHFHNDPNLACDNVVFDCCQQYLHINCINKSTFSILNFSPLGPHTQINLLLKEKRIGMPNPSIQLPVLVMLQLFLFDVIFVCKNLVLSEHKYSWDDLIKNDGWFFQCRLQNKSHHWIRIKIPVCCIFLHICQPDYHAYNQEHWKRQ